MDLEPEGKIYICISLTGSFIDGKAADTLKSLSNKYLGNKGTKTSTFAIFPSPINIVLVVGVHACLGVTRAGQYVPGMLVCSLQTSVDINRDAVCVCSLDVSVTRSGVAIYRGLREMTLKK